MAARKRMTMGKTAKKTKHRAIPYRHIAKLYASGKSYEAIAKAVGRYNSVAEDPTKSVRAIVSRMLTVGYDVNGKTVKLKRRTKKGRPQENKAKRPKPKKQVASVSAPSMTEVQAQ